MGLSQFFSVEGTTYMIELEKPIRTGFFFWCDGPNLQLQRFLNSVRKPSFPFFSSFFFWPDNAFNVKLKGADLFVIGPSGILRKKGLTYNFRYI